jgi:predicted ATPase
VRKKQPPAKGPYLARLELLRDAVPSFDRYPYCLPAFRNMERLSFHSSVTFLVGENGAGKSTLLEAIAVSLGLNPEGGSRNFNFATRASHSSMFKQLRLVKTTNFARDCFFLRAESFYNVATEIEQLDAEPANEPPISRAYGERALHEQSHGESFFALFENRLRGNGLYLMDEPEAALSPTRQLAFLAILDRYCKMGGQFVIATHSPIIMAYPNACIYVFEAGAIRETPYEETSHYQICRRFLVDPKRSLEALFSTPTESADDYL